MATLFNTKIKDTYQSLLKLEDNTILTTTTKNITDGLGNASPLYMSTTRIGVGTSSPAYTLDVQGTAASQLRVKSTTAGAYIDYSNSSGSTYSFGAYLDGFITVFGGTVTSLLKSDGTNTFGNTLTSLGARLGIKGSGSTSATTSLLVQNSSGQQTLSVTDDGKLYVGFSGAGSIGGIYVPFDFPGYGARNFLFNSSGNAMMKTISNDEMGFNLNCYFDRAVGIAGNFLTGLNMTTHVSAANSTASLIRNSGTNWSTQSNGTCIGINLQPIIDTDASSSSAKYIGFYWNPNIADLQSAKHNAIETVTGNVLLGTTSGNVLIGTTTDDGSKLRVEGNLSLTGYIPRININGSASGRSYMKTDLAVEGGGMIGGIGLNTDTWLTQGAPGPAYNIGASIHFKVNGTNPLTSATSHWLAGDNGKNVGYEFLTTHYRLAVPSAWYGPEISGGIVGLQQFNIGYEPKQYAGAGFTFVGVGLSGVVSDPFTRNTEFNPIRIDYSLASGGSNITARGVYYNPTFTSVYPLLVNNAFESTSGSLVMSGEASRVSSTVGRGAYLNQTLRPSNMTGDTLIGLDINPTFTSSATQISTFSYVGGSGYTIQTTWTNIPLTGGTGTGATVNITVGAGNLVTVLTMANRGTGYTVNDVLTLPAQNIFTVQAGGSGFSLTVTAVGASTYNSYGLLVRSGNVGVGEASPTARLQVKGSGSTSATTALLVQNSAGTAALTILDDRTANFSSQVQIQSTIFADSGQIFRSSGNLALQSVAGVGNNKSVVINASPNITEADVAILVCNSTTKGFLPPRVTTIQKNAISGPVAGLMVYDTDLARPCFFNGATWITL
jgi:hypothetical protein